VRKWIAPLLIVLSVVFTAVVYSRLPGQIATHFGVNGPDRWSGRSAAWLFPGIALGIWALLTTIPRIDPHRANYAKFQSSYDTIVIASTLVTVLVQIAVLGSALGWPIRVETVVPLAVGGLFIVIGELLPRSSPTWFFGIRTPWTLSNDIVWKRTHRVGGFLMIIAGLLVMSLAFLRSREAVYTVIALTAVLIFSTVPYSYFVYRSETAGKQSS
jgi:uncharacterized membrane protein